jgi:anti-sigma B factor antagonist
MYPQASFRMFPRLVTLLSFQTTVTADRAIVVLAGELDVAGAEVLENEIERIVADHDARELVLDLSQLDFMDSTGLRMMVLADQRAAEENRRLTLVRGRPDVQRVFEITRMTERLRFVDAPPDGGSGAEGEAG